MGKPTLIWWNDLTFLEKDIIISKWLSKARTPGTITFEEIKFLSIKENK